MDYDHVAQTTLERINISEMNADNLLDLIKATYAFAMPDAIATIHARTRLHPGKYQEIEIKVRIYHLYNDKHVAESEEPSLYDSFKNAQTALDSIIPMTDPDRIRHFLLYCGWVELKDG